MPPFVIGIAGGTGSGKTTVARRLYESLHLDSAVFLDQDSYCRELFDLRIFVDTEADVRFIRRLQRDLELRGRTIDSVIDQYLTTAQPMHFECVEPSKRYADIILPRGGQNLAGIEVIAARIRERLGAR